MAAFVPASILGAAPVSAPPASPSRPRAVAEAQVSRAAPAVGGQRGSAEHLLLGAVSVAMAGAAHSRRQRKHVKGAARVVRQQGPATEATETAKLQETAERVLLNNYGKRSLAMVRGEGHYLFDADGKKYLDFGSGIAVNCLGHADKGWVEAAQHHAATLCHTSNLYLNPEQVKLGEKLVKLSFADKAFFANSGTEANEAAIKFARKLHYEAGKPREKMVAFESSFHGRTMGSLALTWKEQYKTQFQPLMPSVDFCTFNDPEGLDKIDEETCAVFVEPMQGEGGVIPANKEFMQALRRRCDEVGAVLVFDEVQCGLGRTGHVFAHEMHGVTPDLMTLAKPLAGGLPIAAVMMTEKMAACIAPGDHGSTFAGAPFVCGVANYVVDRVSEPAFLQNVTDMGERLRAGLRKIFDAKGYAVRGQGLLCGVVFDDAASCGAVFKACQDLGLLVLTAGAGNVLRVAPDLTIGPEEVDLALERIEAAVAAVDKAAE